MMVLAGMVLTNQRRYTDNISQSEAPDHQLRMASRITDSGAITPSLETSLVTSSTLSSSQSWVIDIGHRAVLERTGMQ